MFTTYNKSFCLTGYISAYWTVFYKMLTLMDAWKITKHIDLYKKVLSSELQYFISRFSPVFICAHLETPHFSNEGELSRPGKFWKLENHRAVGSELLHCSRSNILHWPCCRRFWCRNRKGNLVSKGKSPFKTWFQTNAEICVSETIKFVFISLHKGGPVYQSENT